jgi:hypothetical protein
MNKRIQELLEQAGVKFVVMPKDTEYEKFAELVVKEMLQTCEDHPAWTGRMIGEQIKEHFGVEEPKGWICPKCSADRTKIACPLGFGATVDGRCPMTVEAQ